MTAVEYGSRICGLIMLAKVCPARDRGRVYAEIWSLLGYGLLAEQRRYGREWLTSHCFCLMPRFVADYDPSVASPLGYMRRLIAWTAPRTMAKEKAALSIPADPGSSARAVLKGYSYARDGAMDLDEFAALIEQAQLEAGNE